MTISLAYNTLGSPVVVDDQGFTIGGGEWGVVDTLDPAGRAALESGEIIVADEDALREARGSDPFVASVLTALDDRRARVEAVSSQSKDDLLAAADPETVESLPVGGDGKPAKADLVDAIVADQTADGEPVEEQPKAAAKKTPAKKTSSRSAAK